METFNGQRARDSRDTEKEDGCEICKMHVKLKNLRRRGHLESLDLDATIK